MNAAKQTCALALALGALGMGCGSDGGNNDSWDGGSLMDASLDSGSGDSGYPCTSYTKATAERCGGSHCQETPQQLRMATPTTAKCGSDTEVEAFCSLKAVDEVGNCAVASISVGAPDTKTCAQPKLPGLRESCLDCYIASANCAKDNCLLDCVSRETRACDECRIRAGCIEQFYNCSEFNNPLPPEYRPPADAGT